MLLLTINCDTDCMLTLFYLDPVLACALSIDLNHLCCALLLETILSYPCVRHTAPSVSSAMSTRFWSELSYNCELVCMALLNWQITQAGTLI